MRHDMIGETSHNGYVSVAPRNFGVDYEKAQKRIGAEGLTWAGPLDIHDSYDGHGWFLGFDTMHAWNMERPESMTYASVRAKTIELANEMVDKGI